VASLCERFAPLDPASQAAEKWHRSGAGRKLGRARHRPANRQSPPTGHLTWGPDTGKGLCEALAQEKSAEIGRLAAEVARSLGCGGGLGAAEAVIRAGMLQAGCGMLGRLLAADLGYRGPRVDCGQGHAAEFVSYRDKVIDTVLGPVTLTRAWYHCKACEHGLAPRDAELGVAAASLSPGLAAMNDRAAAAEPFAGAAGLLEDLAGVRLTAKARYVSWCACSLCVIELGEQEGMGG
jgi:hypothetical protein